MEHAQHITWKSMAMEKSHIEDTIHVNVTGERTAHIPPQKVRELVNAFDTSDYLNLRDWYDEIRFTDQSSVETSIRINGIYKSVYDYYGTVKVPELEKLRNLEKMINNVANSSQWVGNFQLSFEN